MRSLSRSRLFWIFFLCLGLTACSGALFRNYGTINPDNAATQAFESYQVDPDFRYYVSGSHVYPNALIGVQKDYRLDPQTLWREVVGMTPAKLQEIVEHMRTKADQVRQFQHGFALRDPQGKQIGIWYSPLHARTLLKMNEDGTVRIDTPEWDVYDIFERDGDTAFN